MVVTECVVDVLEAVEIQHQHRPRLAAAFRSSQRLQNLLTEQPAVGEARETVVECLVLECGGVSSALRNVAYHREREGRIPVRHATALHLDGEDRAVAVPSGHVRSAAGNQQVDRRDTSGRLEDMKVPIMLRRNH